MTQTPVLLHYSPFGRAVSPSVRDFIDNNRYNLVELTSADEVLARGSRAYPPALIIDVAAPRVLDTEGAPEHAWWQQS